MNADIFENVTNPIINGTIEDAIEFFRNYKCTKENNPHYFLKPGVFLTCSLIRAYSLLDPPFLIT